MQLKFITVSLGVTLLALGQGACGGEPVSPEATTPTPIPAGLPARASTTVTQSTATSPEYSTALTPLSDVEQTPASIPTTGTTAIPAGNPDPVATGTKVGDRIPDFKLKLVDGSTLTSTDLRQRRQPAFLFFYAEW